MELRKSRVFINLLFPLLRNGFLLVRLVQLFAFKLLRLVVVSFQSVYWQLNGTARQVREADRPENYERSAQILDVRLIFKFVNFLLFRMEDFICTHNRFVSPQYVFDNDNINLMFVTDTHAAFCEPSGKGRNYYLLKIMT